MFISLRNLLGLRLKSGRNSSREGEWRMKRKRKGRKNRGRRQEAHTWDHTCELESSLGGSCTRNERGDYDRFVARAKAMFDQVL